jgi:Family of unknown function (DUF6445)
MSKLIPTNIILRDDFITVPDLVREMALKSGFGKWNPGKADVGGDEYKGACFWGLHAPLTRALTLAVQRPIYVNNMSFRVMNTDNETAVVHSDFLSGNYTCVYFLTDHPEHKDHGLGFYKHIETGWTRTKSWEWLNRPENKTWFDTMKRDTHEYKEGVWEKVGFIPGKKNRAVIFDSAIFHRRSPPQGIGTTPEDGRMIWVCHFAVEGDPQIVGGG